MKKLMILALVLLCVVSASFTVFAKEQKTLTIWGQDPLGVGNMDTLVIPEFEKTHPNIKVNYKNIHGNQIIQELLKGFVAGEVPDIVHIDNPDFARFASEGMLLDLTKRINKSKVVDVKNFNEASIQSVSWNGKIYGLPLGNDTLALFYNADMFRAAGLDPDNPPQTWAELADAAAKLTDKSKGVYGFGWAAEKPKIAVWQWSPFLYQAGGNFGEINSPAAVEALTYVTDFVKKGYTSLEIINSSQGDITGAFLGKRYAIIVMGNWVLPRVSEEADFEWRTTTMPYKEGVGQRSSCLGGWTMAIPKGAKNPDAAWEYMEAYNQQAMWAKVWNYEGRIMPVNNVEAEAPNYENSYRVFQEQMKYTFVRGPHPKWPQIDNAICDAIQNSLRGVSSPQKALDDAAKLIQPILKEVPWPNN